MHSSRWTATARPAGILVARVGEWIPMVRESDSDDSNSRYPRA